MLRTKKKYFFSTLFNDYYQKLYNYAFKVLKEKEPSEEVVQETFIKLWEKFNLIKKNERAIQSFLIVTLKNKLIDFHRKKEVRNKHTNIFTYQKNFTETINNDWELYQEITLVYNKLPLKTVEIFKLSREVGLSYKEIASKKKISLKTVEFHISKSLNAFRKVFFKKK